MRDQLLSLFAAAGSSTVVWHLGRPDLGPATLGLVSMACAVAGLLIFGMLVKAWRLSRPIRVEWHRGRARALSQAQDRIGWLIPGSAIAWLALEVLSWAHTARVASLGVG